MAESILSAPYFHNEEAAYEFVESRIWPSGPVCPHCGCVERIEEIESNSCPRHVAVLQWQRFRQKLP